MDEMRLSRQAGTLTITAWYDGVEETPAFGNRRRWGYRLEDTADPSHEPVTGADLYLSPVAPNDAGEAMRSLLSFLTACGESYEFEMRHPGSEPENLDLFPSWVPEAAYLNSDELAMLALELSEPEGGDPDPAYRDALADGRIDPVDRRDPNERAEQFLERDLDPELAYALVHEVDDDTEPQWPPARWFDVVFLQGDEGYDMVDFIDEHGVDAAIEHLSNWDFQEETRNTALFHGHVYDEPPSTAGDHTAESGPNRLQWNTRLGHVNLLRRFEPSDERPSWWPERTARLSPATPPDIEPEPPAHRDPDRGLGGPSI